MSTNLFWRPVPKEFDGKAIGYSIKFIISPKLWGHDGSLSSEWSEIDSDWIPYLYGVADAGNEEVKQEAKNIIALLEKYGEIEISLMG